ncbi:MAG: hypothetical protein IAI48_02970 [Candidatus Eremiobacteraeota bacterium]|nr:hypothetical protein [Candidatus Eremiobacteraeota bacterium]
MPRFLAALIVASLARAPAFAASTASPSASPSTGVADQAVVRAKDAGTIDGEVVAVDYRSGTMSVQSATRHLDVVVLPSTNIVGGDTFHTIADIKKGSHVRVSLSLRAGTYIAQIIHLR